MRYLVGHAWPFGRLGEARRKARRRAIHLDDPAIGDAERVRCRPDWQIIVRLLRWAMRNNRD